MKMIEPAEILPTPERASRGIERVPETVKDIDGRPAQPFRSIDILAALHRRGAITKEMLIAGERFRATFNNAQLDPLRAADLSRPMVSGRTRSVVLSTRVEEARESIWQAMIAVGGVSSAAGNCLWHVIGWEQQLKRWALEQGIAGRQISADHAAGVLMSALDALAIYYEKSA